VKMAQFATRKLNRRRHWKGNVEFERAGLIGGVSRKEGEGKNADSELERSLGILLWDRRRNEGAVWVGHGEDDPNPGGVNMSLRGRTVSREMSGVRGGTGDKGECGKGDYH